MIRKYLSNPDHSSSQTQVVIIQILLARVVRKVDNAIHRINHYPADSALFC